MFKPHPANDEKPAVLSGAEAGRSQESESHHLVRDPSFPRGSIGNGKAWQHKGLFEHPRDTYDYVALQPLTQVWQDITLPVAANPAGEGRPDFWLGCEYDTGFLPDCTLKVYDFSDGKEGTLLDTRVMEGIKPETSPAPGLRPLPEPEALNWTTLPLQRIENLDSGISAIRIKYEAADGNDYLNVRNTDLDVRLPELKAKVTLVVDPDGLKIEQTAAPYKICHGAKHRLEVSGVETDSWLEQKASLSWHGEQLPVEYALQAEPPFNRGAPDEESFQPLEDVTAWSVESSASAQVISGDLQLGLSSYWQADIWHFEANVGDHVHDLSPIEGGEIALVIDDQSANSATLTTLVSNYFIPERSIEGAQVEWLVNGQPFATEPSDENGRSLVTYTAQKGDEGSANEAEITAICRSLEGYPRQRTQKIRVFATSPWPAEMEVWLNGKEVDVKTVGLHLKRGSGNNTLLLKPKGDYFVGKAVSLRSPEGSAEKLGIGFSTEPRVMPKEGLEWAITSGEGRGLFVLDAVAAGLNVPFSLEGGQTSADLADEVDLNVAGAMGQTPPLFWRSKAQVFSMVPKPGSALERMALKASLRFIEGSLAQGDMSAVPTFNDGCAPEGGKWSWSLTGGAASGTFGLEVTLEGFSEPVSLAKALLLSPKLADEMLLTVQGDAPRTDNIFIRSTAQEVELMPKAGSPIADAALKAKMTFVAGTLGQEDMTAEPGYDNGNDITASGAVWSLTGKDVSGTFGLKFSVDGFDEPVDMRGGVLLSGNLADELDMDFTNQMLQWGKTEIISVQAKAGSPLETLKLRCKLKFNPAGAVSRDNLTAVPDYDSLVEWMDGRIQWELTGRAASGEIGLDVILEDERSSMAFRPLYLMSAELSDEVELFIDGKSVKNEPFRLTPGKEVKAMLRPKSGSPVRLLECWFDYFNIEVPTRPERKIRRTLTVEGVTWQLTAPARNTQLKMGFYVEGFGRGLESDNYLVLPDNLEEQLEITRKTDYVQTSSTIKDYFKVKCPVGSLLAQLGEKIQISYEYNGYLSSVSFSPGMGVNRDLVAGGMLAWDVTADDVIRSGATRVVFKNRLFDTAAYAGPVLSLTTKTNQDLNIWFAGQKLNELRAVVDSQADSLIELKGVDNLLAEGAEIRVRIGEQVKVAKVDLTQRNEKTWNIRITAESPLETGHLDLIFSVWLDDQEVFEYWQMLRVVVRGWM